MTTQKIDLGSLELFLALAFLMCLIFSRSPKREGRRPSFHSRLPLPVILATAPGVFAERRVRCRTSRCRNTHFGFPVGVGDFAKVPGGVLTTPPVPVKIHFAAS